MPDMLSVREVCEGSLEKIGAFTVHDTGADQDELHRAAKWLDWVVGHLTAEQRALWLVEDTVTTAALTADTIAYDLLSLLDNSAPATGIQFPITAWIRDDAGRDHPCEIINRDQYEAIQDKDRGGQPCKVYIDRLEPRPKAYFYPVPAAGATYYFRLVFQRYATDATEKPIDKKGVDLRKGWNLWAVTALAAEIGDGPVRKLPDGEVTRMRKRAGDLLFDLQANDNQEQASAPRRTAFNLF